MGALKFWSHDTGVGLWDEKAMPYKSQAQSRYIHMKANEGEGWAKKFVSHSHGQHVSKLPEHKGKRQPPALSRKKK